MFLSIVSFLPFWNIFSSLSISSIYLPDWLKSLSDYQLFWTMWVIYDEHFNVLDMKTRSNMFTCDLSKWAFQSVIAHIFLSIFPPCSPHLQTYHPISSHLFHPSKWSNHVLSSILPCLPIHLSLSLHFFKTISYTFINA